MIEPITTETEAILRNRLQVAVCAMEVAAETLERHVDADVFLALPTRLLLLGEVRRLRRAAAGATREVR